MRRIPDQTLFAWGEVYRGPDLRDRATSSFCLAGGRLLLTKSLLARSISQFATHSRDVTVISHTVLKAVGLADLQSIEYTPTPQGIRTRLPVVSLPRVFFWG